MSPVVQEKKELELTLEHGRADSAGHSLKIPRAIAPQFALVPFSERALGQA